MFLKTLAALVALLPLTAHADARADQAETILSTWYHLTLELVRHTPTYTPPVASRTLAYMGVAAYQSVASGDPTLQTLAGQLNGLITLPARDCPAFTSPIGAS